MEKGKEKVRRCVSTAPEPDAQLPVPSPEGRARGPTVLPRASQPGPSWSAALPSQTVSLQGQMRSSRDRKAFLQSPLHETIFPLLLAGPAQTTDPFHVSPRPGDAVRSLPHHVQGSHRECNSYGWLWSQSRREKLMYIGHFFLPFLTSVPSWCLKVSPLKLAPSPTSASEKQGNYNQEVFQVPVALTS